MVSKNDEKGFLLSLEGSEQISDDRSTVEVELLEAKRNLELRTDQLTKSEAKYRLALKAGRLVHWETDLVAGTRIWTKDAMDLFGIALIDGLGQFGNEFDEFRLAVHPDDRTSALMFYELANTQDWFPAEYRIIKPDGTVRWLSGGGLVTARLSNGRAARLMNVVADVTERKIAEQHKADLARELHHRAKNLLAVINAIVIQTGRTAKTIEEFKSRFGLRVQSLAASHDILVLQNWQGASLNELITNQLAPFVEPRSSRCSISGPEVMLHPKAAEAVGMALHELATNALKYGALSVDEGRVHISWGWDKLSKNAFELRWNEVDGPVVTPPTKTGFGVVVCQRVVTDQIGGEVEMDFGPKGLSWILSIPPMNIITAQSPI